MKKKARDPIVVALILFILLFIALMAYLASAAIRKQATGPPKPWAPTGWTPPTYPPPSKE